MTEKVNIDEIIASLKTNEKIDVIRIIEKVSTYRRIVEVFLVPAKVETSNGIVDLDGLQKLLEGLVSCQMEVREFEQVGDDIYFGYLRANINVMAAVNRVEGEKWENFTIHLYPNILIGIPAAYSEDNIYYRSEITRAHYYQTMIAAYFMAPHFGEIGLLLSNLAEKKG
ncbi:MAG: hypothetical protein KAI71_02415 [Candidatus Pacebacteria bacterium]|nr:hypothetical protein [Candidatus Paceibacterota bacterium]